jgi:hypothetical protein
MRLIAGGLTLTETWNENGLVGRPELVLAARASLQVHHAEDNSVLHEDPRRLRRIVIHCRMRILRVRPRLQHHQHQHREHPQHQHL